MALADKFKSFLNVITEGVFENPDETIYDVMSEEEGKEYPTRDNLALNPEYKEAEEKNKNSKVKMHPNYKAYEVIVCEPRSYEDSMAMVQHLKDRKTVILNLRLLDKEQGTRIVDFLCGATHALSGSQQKVGDSVFIFTPVNVALSSEAQKSQIIRDALWNQPQM